MLWYHLGLCIQLVCRRRQPPPFPHLARAEGPHVIWSFSGGRAEHESAKLSLQAFLHSGVVSVMKEKCSKAREGGSANSTAKERPFHLEWHPPIPPHSEVLSPGVICSPYPQFQRTSTAWQDTQCPESGGKPVSGTPACFSRTYDFRPSSGDWARSPVVQHFVANRKSPALNSTHPLSLPPYVHIRPLCSSPANSFQKHRLRKV